MVASVSKGFSATVHPAVSAHRITTVANGSFTVNNIIIIHLVVNVFNTLDGVGHTMLRWCESIILAIVCGVNPYTINNSMGEPRAIPVHWFHTERWPDTVRHCNIQTRGSDPNTVPARYHGSIDEHSG